MLKGILERFNLRDKFQLSKLFICFPQFPIPARVFSSSSVRRDRWRVSIKSVIRVRMNVCRYKEHRKIPRPRHFQRRNKDIYYFVMSLPKKSSSPIRYVSISPFRQNRSSENSGKFPKRRNFAFIRSINHISPHVARISSELTRIYFEDILGNKQAEINYSNFFPPLFPSFFSERKRGKPQVAEKEDESVRVSQEESETIRSGGRVRGVAAEAEREEGEGDTGPVEETRLGRAEGAGREEEAAGGGHRFGGPSSGLRSNLVDVDGRENPYRRSHLHQRRPYLGAVRARALRSRLRTVFRHRINDLRIAGGFHVLQLHPYVPPIQ